MNAQERIDEIKEQIGYEDYTLYNIPMYVDDELVILHVDYKVPAGYVLKSKTDMSYIEKEIKELRTFVYDPNHRNRYYKFKKSIKLNNLVTNKENSL